MSLSSHLQKHVTRLFFQVKPKLERKLGVQGPYEHEFLSLTVLLFLWLFVSASLSLFTSPSPRQKQLRHPTFTIRKPCVGKFPSICLSTSVCPRLSVSSSFCLRFPGRGNQARHPTFLLQPKTKKKQRHTRFMRGVVPVSLSVYICPSPRQNRSRHPSLRSEPKQTAP